MTQDQSLQDQLFLLSDNICLYYSRLVDDIHQRLMEKALQAGYQGLKLSHALILPQIAADGSRIIDIARSQGVSKQAVGQIANELEKLGFIRKAADPHDKRSKKLLLTDTGIALVQQSAFFMQEVDRQLAEQLGQPLFDELSQLSRQLFQTLRLKFPDAGQYMPQTRRELPLIVYATSIATYLDRQLKDINSSKGHPPLKRSYWHILEKIARKGSRINDLAEMNGISKQAISQLAAEIEKAGYIARIDDPSDGRSKQLVPTDKGLALIRHTLASTRTVEAGLEASLGSEAFARLKHVLWQYQQQLEQLESPTASLDVQLRLAITNVLQQYPPGFEHPWLKHHDNGTRLSSTALAALKTMVFY